MRRPIAMWCVVLLAILAAGSGFTAEEKKAVWKPFNHVEFPSPIYSQQWRLEGGDCYVSVFKDGSGLFIHAQSPGTRPQRRYRQEISILLGTDGKVLKEDNRYISTGTEQGYTRWLTPMQGEGIDVFKAYYLEAAQQLPPEVKRLFFGLYGLK